MRPDKQRYSAKQAVDLKLTNWAPKEHRKEYLDLLEVGHLGRCMMNGLGPFGVILKCNDDDLGKEASGPVINCGWTRGRVAISIEAMGQ